MKNEYNGFSLFQDVKDTKLRAYNQLVVIQKLKERKDHQGYIEMLSQRERAACLALIAQIHAVGFETVKAEVIRDS